MNVLAAEVSGTSARIAGHEIKLDRAYPALPATSKIEIGVRPEFVQVTREAGLPVQVSRIDDVGRLKILELSLDGIPIKAVAGEDTDIPSTDARIRFDIAHVNVYSDGHRVAGEPA
jgi:glycerol transport system ATP-binding protein